LNVVGMTTHNKTPHALQKPFISDNCKVDVVKLKLLHTNKQIYELIFILVIGDFRLLLEKKIDKIAKYFVYTQPFRCRVG
jgi:hypothetical protein